MSWMTSSSARQVRGALRSLGLIKLLMIVLRKIGYEQLFTRSMQKVTKPGYCVWDIGANIGVYSRMFGELVGPSGRVYAFEPLPETLGRLNDNVSGNQRIMVMPLALSNSTGIATIERGTDEDAATARIANAPDGGGINIYLEKGDLLVHSGQALPPDVIKIDVEGHELEVLEGMKEMLAREKLKHVFIEVHFAILHCDNRGHVPGEIERLLRSCGFGLRWVDQSHLHAHRV